MSTPWAIAVGAGSTVVFIILCLALFGWWLGKRDKSLPSTQAPTESPMADEFDEPADTLIPEAEALHNAPSGAAPGVTIRTVKKKPAKKKAKAPAKPRRTPKTRRTRFDRIDDD